MTKAIHKSNARNDGGMDTKKSVVDSDWISTLAKQATLHAGGGVAGVNTKKNKSKHHQKKNDAQVPLKTKEHEIVLSKQERIERRQAKKRRREERKGIEELQTKHGAGATKHAKGADLVDELTKEERYDQSIRQLELLKEDIYTIVLKLGECQEEENITQRKQQQKHYTAPDIKGKATVGQQLTDENIQPRKNDYGGLGLARNSLLISLRDVSFVPKLEQEFAEHIHGFFGKQRTKAMKKQLDGNMLWRRLQKQKDADGKSHGRKKNKDNFFGDIKVDGKKLSDMTPDERVEAMIKLDMI